MLKFIETDTRNFRVISEEKLSQQDGSVFEFVCSSHFCFGKSAPASVHSPKTRRLIGNF